LEVKRVAYIITSRCRKEKRIPLYITTSTSRSGQERIKNERLFPSPTFFETFTCFQKPQFRPSPSRIPLLAPLRPAFINTARTGITIYTSHTPSDSFFKMTTTSMVQPKFLRTGDELGVVAVGFSGGQVRHHLSVPFSKVLTPSVQTRSRRSSFGADLQRSPHATQSRTGLQTLPR
jgi:hypothetical protein